MKTSPRLLAFSALVVLGLSSTTYAESKRTAEYLLISPAEHLNKDVTLDVAMVRPVPWVSPAKDIAFFRAMTIDRSDRRAGGDILVAVPASEAASFARKYGTDFEGRWESDMLKGTFLSATRGDGGTRGPGLWLVDTTGKLADLIATKQFALPGEGKLAEAGPGPRGRRLNQE
jgi:hypothetical protein